MADLERMDFFPISSGSKPKVALPPRFLHVARSILRTKVLVMREVLLSTRIVLIWVYEVQLGTRRWMHWTTEA
jgi:hypothetical protein